MIKELQETIKELQETIKKGKKIDYFKEREEERAIFEKYKNRPDELKAIWKEREEQAKKEQAKEQKRRIKEALLTDNLFYITDKYIFEDIKAIFEKYTAKNIGEKTIEKINQEATETIKNKYGVDASVWLYRETYINQYRYTFTINYNAFKYEYNINDNIKLYYTCEYDEGNKWGKYRTSLNYTELNKINNVINKIIKDREKIEREKQKLNAIIKEYNNNLGSATHNRYGIKEV